MTAILFFLMVFSIPLILLFIPILLIWTHHRRQMEELRMQKSGLNTDVRAELESLRKEVRELRETALQYDLSFDTALQQMERRMAHLEGQRPVTPQEAEEIRIQSRPY